MKSATVYLRLYIILALSFNPFFSFGQLDLKQMSLGFQSIYGQYIAQNNLGLFLTQQYTYGSKKNQNFYIDFGASYGVDPRLSRDRSASIFHEF